ncbi:MAG: alkaline phosphatase family protein, partial [Chloroflexi bacterium]|nr:alkaline phosphatase family protein [Chloroflexota bacterium]
MRSRLLAALGSFLLAGSATASPVPAAERFAVVVSVDGLMPSSYTQPDELGLAIPQLRRLVADGTSAEGVVGVLPSVTYPSHTTMTTGVPPLLHGVAANRLFDPEDRSNEAWTWYAEDVRVPTLLDAARARGLRTAALFWPVTVGIEADLLVPEYWRTGSEHA